MRITKFLILILLISSILSAYDDEENEYVQVYYSIKPDKIKPGREAEILFLFTLKEGIHINLDPPVEIELDNKIVHKSQLEIPKGKNKEYLNTQKPIKQKIKINRNLKPGKYKIKGNLIYYYCSDEEGWCSRFKQPIELNITIIK